MAHQTLDQQRAAFAWRAVTDAKKMLPDFKDFKNLAKGAPALIMGNGLMPALAFYESRGKDPATTLNRAISAWLVQRFASDAAMHPLPKRYAELMERLLVAPSLFTMAVTDETLSMPRCCRRQWVQRWWTGRQWCGASSTMHSSGWASARRRRWATARCAKTLPSRRGSSKSRRLKRRRSSHRARPRRTC